MKTVRCISVLFLVLLLPSAGLSQGLLLPSPGYLETPYAFARDGSFTYTGGALVFSGTNSADALLLSASDGSILPDFPHINGMITAAANDGEGGWYIAGGFTHVDGFRRKGLAHILADGRVNQDWTPWVDGHASDLFIHDHMLYLAGQFSAVNGVARANLARISLVDGVLDAGWTPTVGGDQYVGIRAMVADGEYMYIGGRFSSVNDIEIRNMARISLEEGLPDADWRPDPGHEVTALLLQGDHLYVSGYFSVIGGEERSWLAGGWFILRDTEPMYGIGRFDSETGTHDKNWVPEVNAFVSSIIIEEETLFASLAMDFFSMDEDDELTYPVVVKLSTAHASVDKNWGPDIQGMAVAMLACSEALYLGGSYADMDENPVSALQKISKVTGQVYAEWAPMVRGAVLTLEIDGEWLYFGGDFTIDGHPSIRDLARIRLADGQLDVPMTDARIDVFDTRGKSVYTRLGFTGNHIELDLSALPAGTFILQISDPQRTFNRFFLKRD